jgi:hypothetical protein
MLATATRRAVLVMLLAAVPAHAHFILVAPDSWMSQDGAGGPQKVGPCGNEGGGTPTGEVTRFRPGDTISITIDEVIMHPGHYRVALAVDDRSELPAPPAVTPKNGDPCGSVEIQDPPVFPVLADYVLPHTQPFPGPQTFTVTLPSDVTCTKCTLQIVEYMSRHPQPCFYHHCADISISNEPGATTTLPPTGSTTTTTSPCFTARCSVAEAVAGPACAADTVPAAMRRKLERVPDLLERADASAARRAAVLRRKAKRILRRVGHAALRKPRLSDACAAAIKTATDQIAAGL